MAGTYPECEDCEFNRTPTKSSRWLLLMYSLTILFLMWVIQVAVEAVYKIQIDTTIILIVGGIVGAGGVFYFYSRKQVDEANIEAKKVEALAITKAEVIREAKEP